MNFADKLRNDEAQAKAKQQYENEHYDEQILSDIIETVMRECESRNKAHKLTGYFEYDSWGNNKYRITPFNIREVPRVFETNSVKRIWGITPNHPEILEQQLKAKITNLGFNSSNCGLIPVVTKERIGTNFLGFSKYNEQTIYVVWIDITW